jgi:hypothetical protein
VELAGQYEGFRKRGLEVASVIHEPPQALKAFAQRFGIPFPLLADPDSIVIRRLGLVDAGFTGEGLKDVPYAGSLLLDKTAVVREKFFEEATEYRRTAGSILVLLGEEGAARTTLQADHFSLRASASNRELAPGQRFTLVLDIEMEEHHHAYAPGAHGYRPLRLTPQADALFVFHEPQLPEPRDYLFAPLNETVPVYEGRFRYVQDVTLEYRPALARLGAEPSFETAVSGRLEFQVCSDRVCYPPGSLELRWPLTVRRWVK